VSQLGSMHMRLGNEFLISEFGSKFAHDRIEWQPSE